MMRPRRAKRRRDGRTAHFHCLGCRWFVRGCRRCSAAPALDDSKNSAVAQSNNLQAIIDTVGDNNVALAVPCHHFRAIELPDV